MSKADQSGKAENGKNCVSSDKEGGKERWTIRDSILLEYLAAIADAKAEEIKNQTVFSDSLKNLLLANADLRTKVAANPNMAQRVIGCLPCGQKVVREFIREILRNQPLPGRGQKCLRRTKK